MSVRKQRYNAQEALERIQNDSGDKEDFNSNENNDELASLKMSLWNEDNITQDSTESSDNEASDEGDGTN